MAANKIVGHQNVSLLLCHQLSKRQREILIQDIGVRLLRRVFTLLRRFQKRVIALRRASPSDHPKRGASFPP